MNYLLRNNSNNNHNNSKKIVAVLVCFVLLSGIIYLFPTFSHTVSYNLARPLWYLRDKITGTFKTDLQNQVAELTLKTIDYDNILQQNEDLKQQIGEAGKMGRLAVRVLSKPPYSAYDTFVIGAGGDEGLSVGSKVYLSDTILIGTVTSVTAHTSLVTLFSSSGEKTVAELNRTGTQYTLVGVGGANFELTVPKETDVLWGDVFIYPNTNLVTFGSVYYIDTDTGSSFKTLYIKIAENVFSTRWVFVDKI